jgi:hypothetical protein
VNAAAQEGSASPDLCVPPAQLLSQSCNVGLIILQNRNLSALLGFLTAPFKQLEYVPSLLQQLCIC